MNHFAEDLTLHLAPVYRVVLARTGDPQAAEAITASVLRAAMSYRDHASSVQNALYPALLRQLRDYLRRGNLPPVGLNIAQNRAAQDQDRTMRYFEFGRIAQVLRAMPYDQANALALFLFGGMDLVMTANWVGWRAAGAETRLQRALLTLQGRLQPADSPSVNLSAVQTADWVEHMRLLAAAIDPAPNFVAALQLDLDGRAVAMPVSSAPAYHPRKTWFNPLRIAALMVLAFLSLSLTARAFPVGELKGASTPVRITTQAASTDSSLLNGGTIAAQILTDSSGTFAQSGNPSALGMAWTGQNRLRVLYQQGVLIDWNARAANPIGTRRLFFEGAAGANLSRAFTLLAWDASAQRVAVWCEGQVLIFAADSGAQQLALNPQGQVVKAVFHPSKDRIATVDRAGLIQVWSLEDGAQLQALDALSPYAIVTGMDWLPAQPGNAVSSQLVAGWLKNTRFSLDVVDVQSGQVKSLPQVDAIPNAPLGSPDGSLLAAGVGEQVSVWNLKEGSRLWSMPASVGGERITALAFSPDGNYLAAVNGERVDVYRVENGTRFQTFSLVDQNVTSIAFSPDSFTFAASTADGGVHLWPIKTSSNPRSGQMVQ